MPAHSPDDSDGLSRRHLLRMIGMAGGAAAMYQAMTSLGLAADSSRRPTGPARPAAGLRTRQLRAPRGAVFPGAIGRVSGGEAAVFPGAQTTCFTVLRPHFRRRSRGSRDSG